MHGIKFMIGKRDLSVLRPGSHNMWVQHSEKFNIFGFSEITFTCIYTHPLRTQGDMRCTVVPLSVMMGILSLPLPLSCVCAVCMGVWRMHLCVYVCEWDVDLKK